MSYDITRRDRNGILTGEFPQERGQFPITILSDIRPFVFPCENCKGLTIHVVGEQHAGIGIKIPFFSKPLVSTGKGYHALCNTCTWINSKLTQDMVYKLKGGILPIEITNLYHDLKMLDAPAPYSEEFIQAFLASLSKERDSVKKYIESILRHYKFEK
jgi:hypothetical protein